MAVLLLAGCRTPKSDSLLGKHVFPTAQVEAIRDAVLGLDKLDDSSKLAKLLVAK